MNARGTRGPSILIHSQRIGQAVVWLCVAVFWLYVWRLPVWSSDDLFFATRSGLPHGRIAWGGLWPEIVEDMSHRNGRTADILAQIVFSAGPLIGILMAAFCLLQSFAVWRLLCAAVAGVGRSDSGGYRAVALAVGIAAPMSLVAMDPWLAGTTVMFMSATVGYVLGSAMLIAVVVLLWRMREPGSAPPWQLALVVALGCFVGIHHEVLALGIVGASVGLALVTRRPAWRPSWIMAQVILVGVSLWRLSAGGLWHRKPEPVDGLSTTDWYRMVTARTLAQALERKPGLYICLALATVVLAWVVRSRVAHRRVFLGSLSVFVAGCAVTALLGARVQQYVVLRLARRGAVAVYSSRTATLFVLAVGVTVAALIVVVVMMRRVDGAQLVVPMTGMTVAAYTVPVLVGHADDRTAYVPMLMCLVLAAVMSVVALALAGPVEGRIPVTKALAGLVTAAIIGPAVQGTAQMVQAVDLNIAAWRPVMKQIRQAEKGETMTVVLPKALPRPAYSQDYRGAGIYYRGNLAKYYNLSASIRVIAR